MTLVGSSDVMRAHTSLASANFANIDTTFEHGWLDLGLAPSPFNPAATVAAPIHTLANGATTRATLGAAPGASGPATYIGLPVIGFAVQSFSNGVLVSGGVNLQSSYGGNFVQKGTRLIQ